MSLIGWRTSLEENNAFIKMTKHFESKGLSVPRFIAQSVDGMHYLQEDLGDTALILLPKDVKQVFFVNRRKCFAKQCLA